MVNKLLPKRIFLFLRDRLPQIVPIVLPMDKFALWFKYFKRMKSTVKYYLINSTCAVLDTGCCRGLITFFIPMCCILCFGQPWSIKLFYVNFYLFIFCKELVTNIYQNIYNLCDLLMNIYFYNMKKSLVLIWRGVVKLYSYHLKPNTCTYMPTCKSMDCLPCSGHLQQLPAALTFYKLNRRRHMSPKVIEV